LELMNYRTCGGELSYLGDKLSYLEDKLSYLGDKTIVLGEQNYRTWGTKRGFYLYSDNTLD